MIVFIAGSDQYTGGESLLLMPAALLWVADGVQFGDQLLHASRPIIGMAKLKTIPGWLGAMNCRVGPLQVLQQARLDVVRLSDVDPTGRIRQPVDTRGRRGVPLYGQSFEDSRDEVNERHFYSS